MQDARTEQSTVLPLRLARAADVSGNGIRLQGAGVRSMLGAAVRDIESLLSDASRAGRCRQASWWEALTSETHAPRASAHCNASCGCP